MASVIKSSNEATGEPLKRTSAEQAEVDPVNEPESSGDGGLATTGGARLGGGSGAGSGSGSGGFFHIYKKGQGYWTRMGTAITIAVIAAFTSYRLFEFVPTLMPAAMSEPASKRVGLAVAVAFLILIVAVGYWITNKPSNVDFLIATDSEMKKVNWTSRRELIGSTRVVIGFMFFITIFLFLMDLLFGYLFYLMGVLKSGPFGGG